MVNIKIPHEVKYQGYQKVIRNKIIFTLLFGIFIGFSLAFVFISNTSQINAITLEEVNASIRTNGKETGTNVTAVEEIAKRVVAKNEVIKTVAPVNHQEQHSIASTVEDQTVAQKLYNEVRVLCWVLSSPENHEKKAQHIKNTWGKRCNKLIFMSTVEDKKLGAIKLDVHEGRLDLWNKTKEAFKYVYKHHLNDYDWFFKADDDTYTVVENLRYMLSEYSTNDPLYFGCRFKPYVKQGYMSGGAGYVLSKEAVKRFVEKGIPDKTKCREQADGTEDVEIGKCLEKIGVIAGDSRDHEKRGRFFPFIPESHLRPGVIDENYWYWKYIYYRTDEGIDCCSKHAISFHYITPDTLYAFDYLIYVLNPYGIVHAVERLPDKIPFDQAVANAKGQR